MAAPIPAQIVQITCPSCSTPYQTPLLTTIDVGQFPELKQAFLMGQINAATCPNCGHQVMLGAPIAYHDAEKQLFLVHIPQEIGMPAEQHEQFIGEMSSQVAQGLPADVPRGYLLTPRRFISLPSLVDAVLEAEGITREQLDQQRARIDLISRLAELLTDDARFAALVEQHKDLLTADFFRSVQTFIQASMQVQQTESAQLLTALYQKAAEAVGFASELDLESGPGELLAADEEDPDLAQLLDQMAAAADNELEQLIDEYRHLIDYSFFHAWTARIEAQAQAGNQAEAERLTARRSQILETIERMDQEAQAMFEAGSAALQSVLDADDSRAALEALGPDLNEAFILVLSANIEAARRSGQNALAEQLTTLSELAVEVMHERLSPEERLIGELLAIEETKERARKLRANMALITPEFVKHLNALADEQQEQGAQPAADSLRQLAREAGAMLF